MLFMSLTQFTGFLFFYPLATVGKRNSHKIPLCKLTPCFTPNGLCGHHFTEIYLGDSLNMPQKDNLQ